MKTYIIESQGYYKIGSTKDIVRRIMGFKNHNPKFDLIKCYDGDFEIALHYRLRAKCYYGEWFSLEERDFKLIDKIIHSNKLTLLTNLAKEERRKKIQARFKKNLS
jgi:hypothetical protein